MSASSTSWKREPFTTGTPIPYTATWDTKEFAKVSRGLIPQSMDDKWFVYYEAPHLFFHRSWTGKPAFRLTVSSASNGHRVTEALAAIHLTPRSKTDPPYEAKLLDFLVSNLLLGGTVPFPLPPGANEQTHPGVLQHVVSGTGYSQEPHKSKKVWWRFW